MRHTENTDHVYKRPENMTSIAIRLTGVVFVLALVAPSNVARSADATVDFNRDIRTILSNKCFVCHGPDIAERQGGLRLDSREGAIAEGDSGDPAIVPNHPDKSPLVRRISSDDDDERMPPPDSGRTLLPAEIKLLTEWVRQGANYSRHWSYIKPTRPELPQVSDGRWTGNPIDRFILARLQREGLKPQAEADRPALVRRVSLDLVGLPPTLAEVDRFVGDNDPQAYERLVDRILEKKAFGEHWARMWLDLARYADSAGYADDPSRTIWAFRDYVIRSFNENKPFDLFTIEQIAGDMLPDPTSDQLIATAFHRNTLTNNEGGTSDEEFRNVAVVDRVNTTMAVWMGTTINCSQCHNHKYDPISQRDYFRLFAIFNNSQDADRRNESPLHEVWTSDQLQHKAALEEKIATLETKLAKTTPELLAARKTWEKSLPSDPAWHVVKPTAVERQSKLPTTVTDDGAVVVTQSAKTDVYTINVPLGDIDRLTAIRLEALPDNDVEENGPGHAKGNFIVTRVLAEIRTPQGTRPSGQFVRIDILGKGKILSLAEVQIFCGSDNVAMTGQAKQSSTGFEGPAKLAIDGNTDGNYAAGTTTHTAISDDPWWEVDLRSTGPIDRIVLWNRTDNNLESRLSGFRISLFDSQRNVVWQQMVAKAPDPSSQFSPSGAIAIEFGAAYANFSQTGFEAQKVLEKKNPNAGGWAIAPQFGKPHTLTLLAGAPVDIPEGGTLSVTIEQLSRRANHTLGRFRLAVTGDASVSTLIDLSAPVLAVLKTPQAQRTDQQHATLTRHFLSIAPELKPSRDLLAVSKKELAAIKPTTTVPIMQELAKAAGRKTHIQLRGNYLATGDEVTAGLPGGLFPTSGVDSPDRLALAKWLVDPNNPLTSRVVANRYWEAIFGIGIVRTSEEFGTQGDLPSHPELLDWLATELVASGWDTKHMLRLIVKSAAYRQSSRVTDAAFERDPDNRLLARGPRFRLSAEMIRDQALFASGLLSDKMHGPSVKPPQPSIGLKAAFGGGIDWTTSRGEDSHRRGLYTTWRRSNPYPSMVTFDAPNREVCTIRRDRTNTPLQALVTLNDPVYVEAAQALARRMDAAGDTLEAAVRHGFRRCLAREPSDKELAALIRLFGKTQKRLSQTPERAEKLATTPLGPAPEGADIVKLAAMTVVANVLLNLDEMIMKR
jgi:hypothetical protein